MPGVDRLVPITRPYKLASREFIPENSRFRLGKSQVGGQTVLIIAGPCSVESRSQILEVAQAVRKPGRMHCAAGRISRAPRLILFRGWAKKGWSCWRRPVPKFGLPIVTEVMAPEQVSAGGALCARCCRSGHAICRTSTC